MPRTSLPWYCPRHTTPRLLVEAASLPASGPRSEEHTSELQSRPHLVCRLLLEKKKKKANYSYAHSRAFSALTRHDGLSIVLHKRTRPNLADAVCRTYADQLHLAATEQSRTASD